MIQLNQRSEVPKEAIRTGAPTVPSYDRRNGHWDERGSAESTSIALASALETERSTCRRRPEEVATFTGASVVSKVTGSLPFLDRIVTGCQVSPLRVGVEEELEPPLDWAREEGPGSITGPVLPCDLGITGAGGQPDLGGRAFGGAREDTWAGPAAERWLGPGSAWT